MADKIDRQEYQLESVSDLELLRAIVAEQEGVELEFVKQEAEPGIAPLIVIALVGAVGVVGGAWAYFQDRRQGGQIIDLRPEATEVAHRDKGVVYGLMVIIAADGKVTVEVKEPKGFFGQIISDVLAAVQGIATKSIEAVAEAAKGATGDKATVTTEPAAA